MQEPAKITTLTVSHAMEALAAIIIGAAVLQVIWGYARTLSFSHNKISREEVSVQFDSSVAVALELLLGADVLATAIAPGWNDIGQLAAITVLRTALNYFSGKNCMKPASGGGSNYSMAMLRIFQRSSL